MNVNLKEGDRVSFDVACLLNCNVWRSPGNEKSEEDSCEQQSLLMKMFNQQREMEILAPITDDEITESFLSIMWYGLKYFKMINVDVLEFWYKIFKLQDENPQWQPALLITEICLCAAISNALLEGLFDQINLVKPTVRNRLKNSVLDALLRIKVSNVLVETFHKVHVLSCVNFWYSKKGRRLLKEVQKQENKGF